MARLYVLDALGLAYRAYHALLTRRMKSEQELGREAEEARAHGKDPRAVGPYAWEPLRNSRGEPTNAIFGLANTLLKVRRDEQPDYWALAWDGPGPTFRHQRFPEYKAQRKPMPEELLAQLPALNRAQFELGRRWPFKYATQFFYVVFRRDGGQ